MIVSYSLAQQMEQKSTC